jgi:hypothetical protein
MEGFIIALVLVLAGWATWWATGVFCPDPAHHWALLILLVIFGSGSGKVKD